MLDINHPVAQIDQLTYLRKRYPLVLLAFLIAAPFAHTPRAAAQTQAASLFVKATPPPSYDVMTIKLNNSASGNVDIDTDNDRLSATNVSLKQLLEDIYDIKQDLISGLSGPVESDRFDIEAKIVDPDREALKKMTAEERRQMILPLLIERFKLKTHIETKTLPVFDLVVLPGGPKFKLSKNQKQNGGGSVSVNGSHNHTKLTTEDAPISSLAKHIAGAVHRTVIDKTGLAGNYDLTLQWSDDEDPDSGEQADPPIFTAIQEQLGLKLRPAKGPVQTLVVDHAEIPSAN